jgi:hypothetical protein
LSFVVVVVSSKEAQAEASGNGKDEDARGMRRFVVVALLNGRPAASWRRWSLCWLRAKVLLARLAGNEDGDDGDDEDGGG